MAASGGNGIPKRKSFLPPPRTFSKPLAPSNGGTVKQSSVTPEEINGNTNTGTGPSEDSSSFTIGDRVTIAGVKPGCIRYFGKVHFAEGLWCGIDLDEPDGKHDGQVEGVTYFSCADGHGIFAPLRRVQSADHTETASTAVSNTSYTVKHNATFRKEKSPSPVKPSHLPQPLSRTIPHGAGNGDSDNETSGTGKHQNKSAIPKTRVLNTTVVHESETKEPSSPKGLNSTFLSKPGKLELNEVESPDGKSTKSRLGPPLKRKSPSSGSKVRSKKEKQVSTEEGLGYMNETVTLGERYQSSESGWDQPGEITSPSRVDAHTALTLAYGLESSGSDSDNAKRFNVRRDSDSAEAADKTFDAAKSFQAPMPDLLQDFVPQDEYQDDGYDVMGCSAISTSSLGLLSESEMMSVSLLTDEFKAAYPEDPTFVKDRLESGQQEFVRDPILEHMDKELDMEIAGIPTPEIDISGGSTTSPELEPVVQTLKSLKPELDLTFNVKEGQTSTPMSPDKSDGTAGEKLASPIKDPGRDAVTIKLTQTYQAWKKGDATFVRGHGDNKADQDVCQNTFNVDNATGTDTAVKLRSKPVTVTTDTSPENFPRRMRTSADLNEVDVTSHSDSFSVTKTAVEQYANLVKAAASEKEAQKGKQNIGKKTGEGSTGVNKGDEALWKCVGNRDRGIMEQSEIDLCALTRSDIEILDVDCKKQMIGQPEQASSSSALTRPPQHRTLQALDTGHERGIMEQSMISLCDLTESVADIEIVDVGGDNGKQHEDLSTVIAAAGKELEEQQLLADLEAGHTRNERPTSMISTCSADTGIVADIPVGAMAGLLEDYVPKERPVSLVSTTSVDTGKPCYHIAHLLRCNMYSSAHIMIKFLKHVKEKLKKKTCKTNLCIETYKISLSQKQTNKQKDMYRYEANFKSVIYDLWKIQQFPR